MQNLTHFVNYLVLGLFVAFLLAACQHQLGVIPGTGGNPIISTNCSPDTAYFQSQVLPLLISNCATTGCHDAATAEDGYVITSYETIMNGRKELVKVGNADNSELYEVMIDSDPKDIMPPPPSSPMSSAELALVKRWINQGALNNSCSAVCDTSLANTFSLVVYPMIETYCLGCHNSNSKGGEIAYDTYSEVKASVDAGEFWGAINFDRGFVPMPEGGNQLASCQLDQIKSWIDNGAQND